MEMQMRHRKEIKKSGRIFMRRNYLNCIVISLISVFLLGGALSISGDVNSNIKMLSTVAEESGSTTLQTLVKDIKALEEKIIKATSIGEASTQGGLSKLYKGAVKSGGLFQSIIEGMSKTIFGTQLSNKMMTVLGVIIAFLTYVFIHGLCRVGIARFYLENRLYEDTHVNKLLFIFRAKRVMNSAKIIAAKVFFLFLWTFTIVGLPIKFYSYYMVSFIIAENPTLKVREALKLSETMMRGNRWKLFKLDLSFVPWFALSFITFGILQLFYVNPYFAASRAEYYMELRKIAKKECLPGNENFVDIYLEEIPADMKQMESSDDMQYPIDLYPVEEITIRPWLHYDYNIKYSLMNLILLFFVCSFTGWVYECILESVKHGMFINRGTMYGPWIPIYGVGGIAVLLLLRKIFDKPVWVFFSSFVICGIIEYTGAVLVEHFKGASYWDYSGYFFNIQGRICLEGLLIFAVASCAAVYAIGPIMNSIFNKIPLKYRRIIVIILVAAFGADFIAAHLHPRTGYGLTYGGQ